jgi:hypothetical protein
MAINGIQVGIEFLESNAGVKNAIGLKKKMKGEFNMYPILAFFD